jgi:hypothetical protein
MIEAGDGPFPVALQTLAQSFARLPERRRLLDGSEFLAIRTKILDVRLDLTPTVGPELPELLETSPETLEAAELRLHHREPPVQVSDQLIGASEEDRQLIVALAAGAQEPFLKRPVDTFEAGHR